MEILAKDLAGRVAKIRIGKDITTPVMAVVVNARDKRNNEKDGRSDGYNKCIHHKG